MRILQGAGTRTRPLDVQEEVPMDAPRMQRRWIPGRQTLSRPEPDATEPTETPAAEPLRRPAPWDPVYDWFDLRRRAERKPPARTE